MAAFPGEAPTTAALAGTAEHKRTITSDDVQREPTAIRPARNPSRQRPLWSASTPERHGFV
jgi:hypothetical protein